MPVHTTRGPTPNVSNTRPANTTPSTPATTTTSPSTPASSNVLRPTIHGADGMLPVPKDFGARLSGVNAPALAANLLSRAAGPDPFAMVPGRYPDAVPLGTVLAAVNRSEQGKAAIGRLIAQFQAATGVQVPPELAAKVLEDPAKYTHLLALSPQQLRAGVDALNAAHRARGGEAPAPRPLLLPKTFDLKNLAAVDAPRPEPKMKELAPGLYQGSLPSKASDAEVKANRVMAEAFSRLSTNEGQAASEKFSVTYQGRTFTRLDSFVEALRADGHEISVTMEQRVANFANLKTVVPGSNPPQFLDVPAGLMVKTGVQDINGKEALVPSVHSELVIRIRKGPNTQGPGVDADIKWYQGTDGTGFFPCNTAAEPSWCGRTQSDAFTGDQALRAIKLAGHFGDVINDTSKQLNLWNGGYGATGVCNDSVAVIQYALTGRTTIYPLLMRDELLTGELNKRLTDGYRRDDADYAALLKSVNDLPTDAKTNPTSRQRALQSLPWVEGREPFQSTVDARKLLAD